jgi:hypothetical protein
VEDGKWQLDMTEMTRALRERKQAGAAFPRFTRRSQSRIERPVGIGAATVRDIVQQVVADIEDSLVDNILMRPAEQVRVSVSSRNSQPRH